MYPFPFIYASTSTQGQRSGSESSLCPERQDHRSQRSLQGWDLPQTSAAAKHPRSGTLKHQQKLSINSDQCQSTDLLKLPPELHQLTFWSNLKHQVGHVWCRRLTSSCSQVVVHGFHGVHQVILQLLPVRYKTIKKTFFMKVLSMYQCPSWSSWTRGVKLMFTEVHVSIMVALKKSVVTVSMYKSNYP